MHSRLRAFVSNTPIKLIAVILITILAPSVIVTALGLVAVLQADSFVRDRFSRPLRDKMQRLRDEARGRLVSPPSLVLGVREGCSPRGSPRLRDLPMSDDHVKDVMVVWIRGARIGS